MPHAIKVLIILIHIFLTPTPVSATPSPAPITTVAPDEVWDSLANCESSGNWSDTSGQFEGGIQFLNSTWLEYGGAEFARHAYSAPRDQQIEVGKRLLAARPDWSAWPACSKKLGLR
jgi:hypothetical protein